MELNIKLSTVAAQCEVIDCLTVNKTLWQTVTVLDRIELTFGAVFWGLVPDMCCMKTNV